MTDVPKDKRQPKVLQRMRLLYLLDILRSQTDREHPMSRIEMQEALAERGIESERKTMYADLDGLAAYGFDIVRVSGRAPKYYLGRRDFSFSELRILVDTVLASRFITRRKTKQLIHKLQNLASRSRQGELRRDLKLDGRIKTMNESIYDAVDTIHGAIQRDACLQFRYSAWVFDSKGITTRYRQEGERYQVAPLYLAFDQKNYYLHALDFKDGIEKNFRVDRIHEIRRLVRKRQVQAVSLEQIEQYTRKTFGMFGGHDARVTIRFENSCLNPVVDQFGVEAMIHRVDDEHFELHEMVTISPTFYAWLTMFGDQAQLIAPAKEREAFLLYLKRLSEGYKEASSLP